MKAAATTMKAGKLTLGLPELRQLLDGKTLVVRLKPDMEMLQLSASMIARYELKRPAAHPDFAKLIEAVFAR